MTKPLKGSNRLLLGTMEHLCGGALDCFFRGCTTEDALGAAHKATAAFSLLVGQKVHPDELQVLRPHLNVKFSTCSHLSALLHRWSIGI